MVLAVTPFPVSFQDRLACLAVALGAALAYAPLSGQVHNYAMRHSSQAE